MENFLLFFEQMPSWQKLSWIFICLSLSWVAEGSFPLFKLNYRKWWHAGVNLVFLSFSIIINLIFGVLSVGLFAWTFKTNFGLLHLFELPIWMELLLAIMFLDLVAQYFIHFLLHRYKWMWKLHMVHHSDSKVDATTGTRHHPGDYALREVFALFAIILTGMPIAFYLFYRIISIFFAYFTHANIQMPLWLDKALSYVIITPYMHKFHHHFERPWTDTNFGNIFSFWDRIFGTLVYDDPKKVKYGLDTLDDALDENLKFQLSIPFDKTIKTDY